METSRKLAAIMFTDIVGYSKMIEKDEKSALAHLDEHNEIIKPIINRYDGEIIKLIGDVGYCESQILWVSRIRSVLKRSAGQKSLTHFECCATCTNPSW